MCLRKIQLIGILIDPMQNFANSKYSILDKFCYAEFLSHYILIPKTIDNTVTDSQPVVLQEVLLESNHNVCNYPSPIPLMNSKQKLRCRQVKAVLRYYVPNPHKYPEKYAHHLLFMFYPFRDENDLKSPHTGTYSDKLLEDDVIEIVNRNKQRFEPFGDLVDSAMSCYKLIYHFDMMPFLNKRMTKYKSYQIIV